MSGSGYVWQVSLDGAVTPVAGSGVIVDFPPDGYDPAAEHPALELALTAGGGALTQGAESFMTYEAGALYWTGQNETATFVERITCE